MKKCNLFVSSAVALFLLTGYVQAQVFMVVKDNTSTPYNNLEDAVAAAEAGSTVYIPTGTYLIQKNPTIAGAARNNTLLIDKKLNLIGAGAGEGALHATTLQGDITVTAGGSGSKFEGFDISQVNSAQGDLRIDNVSNFMLKRCRFRNLYPTGKGDGNIFSESQMGMIQTMQSLYSAAYGLPADASIITEILVQNCIVTYTINYLRKAKFTNDVFTGGVYTQFVNVANSVITNNIFTGSNTVDVNQSGSSLNSYTYNLMVGNFSATANNNDVANNITGVPLANIFVDQVRWHLKTGCPGIGAGSDGTDMGIYGGAGAKEVRIPAYPAVTEFTVAGTSTAAGELSAKVKVEAQN